MHVKIRNKVWELVFVRMKNGDHGSCDSPDTKGKKIRIAKGLSPEATLDAIIHEYLHGGMWDMDEEAIQELATDLARILIRLGYQRVG